MEDFDDIWIWDNPVIGSSLGWYRAVAANRMPAKFRIAATVPIEIRVSESSEDALWLELDRLTPLFLSQWHDIRNGCVELGPRVCGASLLELCAELARRMLAHCNFCAWNCQVDRSRATKFGACKLTSQTRVSTFFHHFGEELVYRGNRGSGTIFFTSCNMRCAFCQNGDISTDKDNGVSVSPRELAAMAWVLRMEGCHNINWVGGDPAIHLHRIIEAIALLGSDMATPERADLRRALQVKADGFAKLNFLPACAEYDGAFNAPMLWNSNLYLSEEAIKILQILMDVWLPDLKFGPGRCAIAVARTPHYWETVTRFLKRLHDQGEDMTIRHLIMPDHLECCTYPAIDWLAETMPEVPVNIMDQYRPDNFCHPRHPKYHERYAPLSRRPTSDEIRNAYAYAHERGVNFEAITYEKMRRGVFA